MGKSSKVIRNKKKNKKNVKKVSKLSLVISIWSFPKTVRNLRIAKLYFAPRASNQGEGGTFVVGDGQRVRYGGNIDMLGDMGCGNYYRSQRCV